MPKLKLVAQSLALVGLVVTVSAQPTPTITVEASMAPNADGSPSFAQWVANGIYAAENGLTTYGAAGPSQFTVDASPLPVAANFVTGYSSWEGTADAPAPYDNEEGARASFVAIINGNGGMVNMNGFGVSVTSSDAGDSLGFSYPDNIVDPGDWTYDSRRLGIVFNNGMDISGGFSVIDSGSPDQEVNEIIAIGTGNAYASYTAGEGGDDPNLGDTDQQILNYDVAQVGSYDLTGTFNYYGESASATAQFVVPDAASTCVLLGGTAAALAVLRRRLNLV